MENPEEVLQALDEFQKMRPTEIPRELEDYLSWVAKTGDPVYQWSLIKVYTTGAIILRLCLPIVLLLFVLLFIAKKQQ